MLMRATVGTQLSGSIGGIVAGHHRGSSYFQARGLQTNPHTLRQQSHRSTVALLASLWTEALTEDQRQGWRTYAKNVRLVNRIGNAVDVGGPGMFRRTNIPRTEAGLSLIVDPPTTFNLGPRTAPTYFGANHLFQLVVFNIFTAAQTDPWANEIGSYMLIYAAPPQNSGIMNYRGSYRFIHAVAGNPVPPASPVGIVWPFRFVGNQRVFARAVVSYADGRYTSESFFTGVVFP